MTKNSQTPRKSLNKAFLKVKPNRNEIERFKDNLIQLLDRTNATESEEFHKNLVSDFLKKTYFEPDYFINTKGRNDLVIHTGKTAKSPVGVIIEAKKPTNKAEMLQKDELNSKAFHELILYYLRERITQNNLDLKYLVATNINEWFVFNASSFEKLFAQNKALVKHFKDFEEGRLAGTTTDFFYREIAATFLKAVKDQVEFTYFDIRTYENPLRNHNQKDDQKLIALFKLLSPQHLLKLPFANDSNSLDKRFYGELLHIIGLAEIKKGSKKLIQRKKPNERQTGTLLENAILQLDSLGKISRLKKPGQFGKTPEERLFNVGLELCISWINRILFLKLLEAQLMAYHKNDESYKFLSFDRLKNYDDLNGLFFQVLAKEKAQRNADVKEDFSKVPYLNSSLFEGTDIEHDTIFISNLSDDKELDIYSSTVLKDKKGRKHKGKLNALAYLFEFLDKYDFSSEGSEQIQEENKNLINASVLGLIFEKINGYKDGSFFTPGFITMYMCRETIRKAVIQKFNDATPLSRGAGDVSSQEPSGVSSHGASGMSPTTERQYSHKKGKGSKPKSKRRKIIPYNPKLKEKARQLRNNSTRSEIKLWKALKGKFIGKYDFHRQKPLDEFIADFYCHELRLVIELDGSTHDWRETQQKDQRKENRLNELGINVLRYPDNYIFKHFDSVIKNIKLYIDAFENNDFSEFDHTPLTPLKRGIVVLNSLSKNAPLKNIAEEIYLDAEENTPLTPQKDTPLTPLENTPLTPLERGTAWSNALENTPLTPLERGSARSKPSGRGSAHHFETLDDVYDKIGDGGYFSRQEANNIINSLKICDPAVGSGHFLVSALNEIIAVKNDLKILQDCDGRRLKEYQFEVVNDELIVTDEEGKPFEYIPKSKESQRVQKALFHEKQRIIENCLFGVDLNPNSVKICRLRLWVELLKNAYYTQGSVDSRGHTPNPSQGHTPDPSREGNLQTLPNIDINIKCGNSLISRFSLDANLKRALKQSKWNIDSYRIAVQTYRHAKSKNEKWEMEKLIADIKSDFRSEISQSDPKIKKLNKKKSEVFLMTEHPKMFELSKNEKNAWNEKLKKLTKAVKKLEGEVEAIKNNAIYENAFEWRFEFPEVLDDDGNFTGFDAVIGNPPYGVSIKGQYRKHLVQNLDKVPDYEVYYWFVNRANQILCLNGNLSFIIPNSILFNVFAQNYRLQLFEK